MIFLWDIGISYYTFLWLHFFTGFLASQLGLYERFGAGSLDFVWTKEKQKKKKGVGILVGGPETLGKRLFFSFFFCCRVCAKSRHCSDLPSSKRHISSETQNQGRVDAQNALSKMQLNYSLGTARNQW